MKNIVIDVHAHFIPRLLYARYDANAGKFPGVRLLRDGKGTRMQFPGGEPTRPISPKLSDTADRRAWMDRNGIDRRSRRCRCSTAGSPPRCWAKRSTRVSAE